MTNKTVIFGAPKTFNLSNEIIRNLEFLGFKVIDISFDQKFKYRSIFQRLKNTYRKVLFNDRSLKTKYRFENYEKDIQQQLSKISKADYALIIRPDNYPLSFIKNLKNKANLLVGYQWDGMHIFPEVKKYVPHFDRFFVFDPKDVSETQLPLTNFYLDYYYNEVPKSKLKPNAFFLGTYLECRMPGMVGIAKALDQTNFDTEFILITNKKDLENKYPQKGFVFTSNRVSFNTYLEKVKESSILIDFLNNRHNGLSFRFFEALKEEKKLITNNPDVRNYDFYHKDNIFVFNDKNLHEISEFLQTPYKKIPNEIKEKYSFTNWIRYVLDLENHTPITLPLKE